MTFSEQVREILRREYVGPARASGRTRVYVAASDIAKQVGWSNRYPLICSALKAPTFREELGVDLISATDPCPSSTTVFAFSVRQ